MKLAIVGSRNFKSLHLVQQFVSRLKPETIVVSGGAQGVDTVAVAVAKSLDRQVEVWPADWQKFGKAAGPIRNKAMIATVDGLVAFWDRKSPGTNHAINEAVKRRIWVRVYLPDGSYTQITSD